MNRPPHPAPRLATAVAWAWHPVEPPRHPVLFVNPRSGGGSATRKGVVDQARQRGIEVVVLGPADDLKGRLLLGVSLLMAACWAEAFPGSADERTSGSPCGEAGGGCGHPVLLAP